MTALPRQAWPRLQPPFAVAVLLAATGAQALPPFAHKWWQKRNMSCLTPYNDGCAAIKDEHTCLSSLDGGAQVEVKGLMLQGQPCAWCGGGACTSGSSSPCQPFDYLVRGEGVAFDTFAAKATYRVAKCGVSLPQFYDGSCLKEESAGCGALKDAASCLSAKDGRSLVSLNGLLVHGQPCVWCGGLPCHADNAKELCQPFDFAASADSKDGLPAKRTLRFATCRNNYPASAMLEGIALQTPGYLEPPVGKSMLVPSWVPGRPSEDSMKCLKYSHGGCRAFTDADSCLRSRDGSGVAERDGFKVQGEPCVWCGGGACHSGDLNVKCEPFDYLMMGKGKAFDTFFAEKTFSVASCKGAIRKPPFDYSCLTKASTSCNALTEASECLSSTDGSSVEYQDGLRVAGQPCVWCGGHSCHSGEFTKCGPFEWLVNAEGRAFDQFYAKLTFTLAACTDGAPFPHNYYGPTNETAGIPNWHWTPPKRLVVAWGQCGGAGWKGLKACQAGYTCKVVNSTYSHCVPMRTEAPAPAPTPAPLAVSPETPTAVPAPVEPAEEDLPLPPEWAKAGDDCYEQCGRHGGGRCAWCGPELSCCRRGWPSNPPACWDASGYKAPWRHECIIPKKVRAKWAKEVAAAKASHRKPNLGKALAAMAPNGTSPEAAGPGALGAVPVAPGVVLPPVPGATGTSPGAATAPEAAGEPSAPGAPGAPGVLAAPGAAGSPTAEGPAAEPAGPGKGPVPVAPEGSSATPTPAGMETPVGQPSEPAGSEMAPAAAPVATGTIPSLPTLPPAMPGLSPHIRGSKGTEEFHDQMARNATNGTISVKGTHYAKREKDFSWVMLALVIFIVCCLLPFTSYYMYYHGCPQRKELSARKKRHVDMNDIEDSAAGRDMPLVSDVDASPGKDGPDLFDLLDANHDGIVTEEEFNRAMGIAPTTVQRQTMVLTQQVQVQAAPVATARATDVYYDLYEGPDLVPGGPPPMQQPRMEPLTPAAARPPPPPPPRVEPLMAGAAQQGGDLFDMIDRNHDGAISVSEFNRAMGTQAVPVATAQAVPVATAQAVVPTDVYYDLYEVQPMPGAAPR